MSVSKLAIRQAFLLQSEHASRHGTLARLRSSERRDLHVPVKFQHLDTSTEVLAVSGHQRQDGITELRSNSFAG